MVKMLTDAAIRKYAATAERRIIRDSGARSLYLIVEPSGAKSFMMRFRRPDGKPAKIVLGPYDLSGHEAAGEPEIGAPQSLASARALAADVHRQRARGIDVIADHKARRHRARLDIVEQQDNAFLTCARDYVSQHVKPRIRRSRETMKLLGFDPDSGDKLALRPGGLAERWANRPIAKIDTADIWAVIEESRQRGNPGIKPKRPGLSEARPRRLGATLSAFFGWLHERRRIKLNPCADLHQAEPPAERERVLSPDEIRWFWQACDGLGEPFGAIFKLLLLTGQRLNEIAGIRRSELADSATLKLPGERTKNRKPHTVPLPPTAQALIGAATGDHEIVFSTTGRTPPSGWSRAKKRLDAIMLKLAQQERGDGAVIQSWTLHDLRRCAVTGMAELGIRPDVVELVVNHISGHRAGVAGIYDRSEKMPERREALARWDRHMAGLVAEQPVDKVVALRHSQGGQ